MFHQLNSKFQIYNKRLFSSFLNHNKNIKFSLVNLNKNILVNHQKYFLFNINTNMQKTSDENRRVVQGTEHSIKKVEGLVGGKFTKSTKAPFLEERLKVWDELYAKQQEDQKKLPREKIVITLKDGKEVEGVSFDTTPQDIAKKYLPRSVIGDLLAAKVNIYFISFFYYILNIKFIFKIFL